MAKRRSEVSTLPQQERRSSAQPAGEGDSISASIGNDARGVVVGKNVFQSIIIVGSVKIPVVPVLALILLVIAAAAFFGLRMLGPDRMTGTFNLAVAEFGQEEPGGKVVSSEVGQQISKRLFDGLKIELDSLSPTQRADFQPQVWQDSLDITQKRVKIGIIPGSTPQDRWTAACALAEKINATVMIYGNLPVSANQAAFVPEFAVCADPGLKLDADEIVGSHQLIGSLPVQLLTRAGQLQTDLAVNRQLNTWTNALSYFSIGILYDLQGLPDLALQVFDQAKSQLGSAQEPASSVLFFFIGREELSLAAKSTVGSPDQVSHLAKAQDAFNESLNRNKTYARAHIGLGGVFFTRAQDTPSAERLQKSDLASALREYQQARDGAKDSPGALIETKAQLGLAATWILQGEAQRDTNQLESASQSFDQSIQVSASAVAPLAAANQFRLLAQAYLTLGEAYHEQGHLKLMQGDPQASRALFTKASDNYELCIRQKDAALTDQTLANVIVAGVCVPNKKIVDASLAQ